ncbi:MAG: AAA family ATPase, partial [Acidithiobacillales bacterium]
PLPINRETTVRAQAWILHTQIAAELEAEAKADVVCCDRAVLDNFCYLKRSAAGDPHVEVLEELVKAWTPTYHLLFRVPIVEGPRFDGVRETDVAFQHEIDRLIAATLREWRVPHVALDPADRARWAELVVEILLPHLHPQELLFPENGPA